jgi:DNA modification methylase
MRAAMKTSHQVRFGDSRSMREIPDTSVALVVTSPPYPMIEMWDATFAALNRRIRGALDGGDGMGAFSLMHAELDPVWRDVHRLLIPGGFACVNVGDAARTVGGDFALYPNHARILSALVALGFTPLPSIIWRKQTNAPNKFMGSGMFPAGAYVTLEHEHVLIVRKGGKREFTTETAKHLRCESALFWEERNQWFSDVWFDLKGSRQALRRGSARRRSGAYPFELAWRLVRMFSVKGDTVLDPFLGTGTTLRAAAASGRDSVGYEIEPGFREDIFPEPDGWVPAANARTLERVEEHLRFVEERARAGRTLRHRNEFHGFPVVTGQERKLRLELIERVSSPGRDRLEASYRSLDRLEDLSPSDLKASEASQPSSRQRRLPL